MEMVIHPEFTYTMSKFYMMYLPELHHVLIQYLLQPNRYTR